MEEEFLSDGEDEFARKSDVDEDQLSVDENDITYGVTVKQKFLRKMFHGCLGRRKLRRIPKSGRLQ